MNKRERVITALKGGEPDRVPAGFWFHFSGEAAKGQGAIDAHVDYFKKCDLDMMKIMCDGYFDYPNPLQVEKAADWYKLEPMGPEHPFFKEQVERTRAIAEDGGEIAINSNRAAFTLISTIQDEVHRFAIGYHRQQRKKNAISTTLTGIPGIGETRARALMKHFRTVRAVSEATVEMLEETPGMNAPAARAVYGYFHPEAAPEHDAE